MCARARAAIAARTSRSRSQRSTSDRGGRATRTTGSGGRVSAGGGVEGPQQPSIVSAELSSIHSVARLNTRAAADSALRCTASILAAALLLGGEVSLGALGTGPLLLDGGQGETVPRPDQTESESEARDDEPASDGDRDGRVHLTWPRRSRC